MTTVVVVVLVFLLLVAALRLWTTANRLDRLHVRTEAAWSALEGALARRIVATARFQDPRGTRRRRHSEPRVLRARSKRGRSVHRLLQQPAAG